MQAVECCCRPPFHIEANFGPEHSGEGALQDDVCCCLIGITSQQAESTMFFFTKLARHCTRSCTSNHVKNFTRGGAVLYSARQSPWPGPARRATSCTKAQSVVFPPGAAKGTSVTSVLAVAVVTMACNRTNCLPINFVTHKLNIQIVCKFISKKTNTLSQ